jgi:hypothetical protein
MIARGEAAGAEGYARVPFITLGVRLFASSAGYFSRATAAISVRSHSHCGTASTCAYHLPVPQDDDALAHQPHDSVWWLMNR